MISKMAESPTKVETKRKSQQFTVSGWLTINGGASDSEKRKLKAEMIFNMKCPYNYQPLFADQKHQTGYIPVMSTLTRFLTTLETL